MEPLVSIIIPVYNVEAYLEKCLSSVSAQTEKNIEIIVVDDGSTDGSGAICDAFAKKDSRAIVIHKENEGCSVARNTGIAIARGKYLYFVDSDDTITPNAVELLYNKAEELRADVVVCALELTTPDNYIEEMEQGALKLFDSSKSYSGYEYLYNSIKYSNLRDEICRHFFSREFFNKHGLAFEKGIYHEDQLLVMLMFLKAERVALIPERVYIYLNRRPGSTMNDPTKHQKRGRDTAYLTRILLDAFKDVKPRELRRRLEDDTCWRYLDSYSRDGMINDKETKPMKKEMLKAAYTFKRKIKALIFAISPKLFTKLF